MSNPSKQKQEVQIDDEESWEVKAFAEDTRNITATTWPPRSYACTFCWREFRSAQALGGHMNVHRRDRARLYQPVPRSTATTSSHPILPLHHHQELSVANDGRLCFLYHHFPSSDNNDDNTNNNNSDYPFSTTHHNGQSTTLMSACNNKLPCSTNLVSVSSPHPPNYNLVVRPTCSPSFNLAMAHAASSAGTNGFSSNKIEDPSSSSRSFANRHDDLDLELRLGHKSPKNN